jgi:hypothetical protein
MVDMSTSSKRRSIRQICCTVKSNYMDIIYCNTRLIKPDVDVSANRDRVTDGRRLLGFGACLTARRQFQNLVSLYHSMDIFRLEVCLAVCIASMLACVLKGWYSLVLFFRSVNFFKDTSWIDVSVSRRGAKRPKYNAIDTDVENAIPRRLLKGWYNLVLFFCSVNYWSSMWRSSWYMRGSRQRGQPHEGFFYRTCLVSC